MDFNLDISKNILAAEGESLLNPQHIEAISKIVTQTVYTLLSNQKVLSSLLNTNTGTEPIREAVKEYLRYLDGTGYSVRYRQSVKITFNKVNNFFNEATPLKNITTKQIEEFIVNLKQKAPKGYKVDFRNLKAFFSKLCVWNYVNENPCTKIKLPRHQKEEMNYMTREELNQVISKTSHPVMKEIFLFAYLTALRLSEITNLRWNDVKLSEGIITIGSAEFVTKSRRIRQIPLINELIEMLKKKSKIISVDGYLFCKADGKKYSNDFVSKSFKKSLRKTSLDQNIHFHSLRHSGISYMLNNGLPVNIVREIAGHSNITTTNIYSHATLDELKNAVKTLDNKNCFENAEGNCEA